MSPPNASSTRVGLVGCGAIATAVHLRILTGMPGVRVVAVADPDPDARVRAMRLARVQTSAEASDVIDRADVDAVVITSPTDTHAQLALAAAAAQKHVYLEKPVATSREDAAAVAAALASAGVVAVVGFNRRFHPILEQAREQLRRGVIGRVRAVQTVFSQEMPQMPAWKQRRATGGGVLLDLASHHADTLRWLVGDEITHVQAWVGSEQTEGDSAAVRWRLVTGVEAQSYFSFRVQKADFFQLIGERGVLRADRYLPALGMWRTETGRMSRRAPVRPSGAVVEWRLRRALRRPGDPSYRRALTRWIAAINGAHVELPGIDDGVASLEAVLAAEESGRQGGALVRVTRHTNHRGEGVV